MRVYLELPGKAFELFLEPARPSSKDASVSQHLKRFGATYLPDHAPVWLVGWLVVCSFVCLFVCLFVCSFVCLFVCLVVVLLMLCFGWFVFCLVDGLMLLVCLVDGLIV